MEIHPPLKWLEELNEKTYIKVFTTIPNGQIVNGQHILVITNFLRKTLHIKNVYIRESCLSKHTYRRSTFVMETNGQHSFRSYGSYVRENRQPLTQYELNERAAVRM